MAVYQIYFGSVANFLFHYGDVLQMAILLTRMKLFSPLLRKYFTASPKSVSFAFFLICFFIDFPYGFTIKSGSLGIYYYFEDSSGTKKYETFYFMVNSDYAMSQLGKLTQIIASFTLNILFSLIVGIVLNIVSFIQYKVYLKRKRRRQNDALNMRLFQNNQIANNTPFRRSLDNQFGTLRARIERDAEKNMLYMVLCLCTISIVCRLIIIAFMTFFLFYYSFSGSLSLMVVFISIYTLVPTVSIFIFYSFNKIYRDEFNRIFFSRRIYFSKTFKLQTVPFHNRKMTFNFFVPLRCRLTDP